MSNHGMHPTNFPGSYALGTTAGPLSFGWAPPTNPNPQQMPAPVPSNAYLGSAGVTNTLSPNAQGPMGLVFPPSYAQAPTSFHFPQSLPPDPIPQLVLR